MKNKLIITAVVMLLISCFAVVGYTIDDYKPKWMIESWDGGNNSGILYNFWHSISPFVTPKGQPAPYDNADIYGWYNNTFFGLFNWEREVCLMDLASDVHNLKNVVEDSELEQTNVYITTVTVIAIKDFGLNNSYLYELSWYIMPFGADASYRVYLRNDDDTRQYIVGKDGNNDDDWVDVGQLTGANGYDAKYFETNFNKAVLEYRDSGQASVNEMSVNITNKVYG